MPRFYGELQEACLENLASDPSGNVAGRIWLSSTEGRIKLDDGTTKRAILRNDQKAVIGNSGTASQNIRLHRGAANLLQFVTGDDSTAEGTPSVNLNQISGRLENYTNAGKPAFGNAGRTIYLTDLFRLSVDTGSAWNTALHELMGTTKGDILVRDSTGFVRLGVGLNGTSPVADSAEPTGVRWANVGVVSTANYTGAYTAAVGDGTSYNDASGGGYTITLPTAVGNSGATLNFVKTDSSTNGVTIGTLTTLNAQNQKITIRSNGTVWVIEELSIPQRFFQSAAVGLGGSATTHVFSHGFGSVPTLWKVFARCVSAQFGYAVNDEIEVPGYTVTGSVGCTGFADATNVGFRVGSQIIVSRRDALADAGLTPANWQVFVRAWKHI